MIEPFILDVHQVPDPPVSTSTVDALRWMVCVMDPDDRELSFVASLLSSALKNDGLSSKQLPLFDAIHARVLERFNLNALRCQEDGQ